MPNKITTGQIDESSFLELFNTKLSGSTSYLSGFYTHDNTSGFVSLTKGGPNSMTGYSGDIMSRVSGLSSQLSGTLEATGELNWQKSVDVSGHAETYTNSASGFLQSEIETVSGNFSTVSGEFLKSGSFYHTGSGDFSLNAPTGALAYSSGYDDSFGFFIATGDTATKAGWMKIPGHPEVTGIVSNASGDLRTSLIATGANLTTSVSNVLSDSSQNFSAKKTFDAGFSTNLMDFNGVTARVNANSSLTFDDTSGALLTLAPGYGPDAPVFSVTDKAGLPLIDVFDDDRLNFGPYGTNPLNVSGEKVCLGNYRSYFSGSNVHLSGDVTINDVMTVSGLSGGYVIFDNLPVHPNTGDMPNGALFISGNNTAGKGRHLMVV